MLREGEIIRVTPWHRYNVPFLERHRERRRAADHAGHPHGLVRTHKGA